MSYIDSIYKGYTIREYSADTSGLHFRVIYSATEESLLLETRKQAEQLINDLLYRISTGGKAI